MREARGAGLGDDADGQVPAGHPRHHPQVVGGGQQASFLFALKKKGKLNKNQNHIQILLNTK